MRKFRINGSYLSWFSRKASLPPRRHRILLTREHFTVAYNQSRSIKYFFLTNYSPAPQLSLLHLFPIPLPVASANSSNTTYIFLLQTHCAKEPHAPRRADIPLHLALLQIPGPAPFPASICLNQPFLLGQLKGFPKTFWLQRFLFLIHTHTLYKTSNSPYYHTALQYASVTYSRNIILFLKKSYLLSDRFTNLSCTRACG